MKPLLVTSGDPAGIGPDICLSLVDAAYPCVILGDGDMLQRRAAQLKLDIDIVRVDPDHPMTWGTASQSQSVLRVWHVPLIEREQVGQLNPMNARYVLELLDHGIEACLKAQGSALVTAPVHKSVINDAGFAFSGHTEYLAEKCHASVVMLLVCSSMRVALVTTHIPLSQVPLAITAPKLRQVIVQVEQGLRTQWGIQGPRILVAGLNPHAGEQGHLGREEIEIITPVIRQLQAEGLNVQGPLPADTLFTPPYLNQADALITMYHDQGLPVLKHAGFGESVNVTLGLPIIRTSVDHGTALDKAGTGLARSGSLHAAVQCAAELVRIRSHVDSTQN